ncbi:MAG: hypothetical protein V4487_05045 [Chlamydiota bacterium]
MKKKDRNWIFDICLKAALYAPILSCASPILDILQIAPSEQSLDYVANKRQFQLHELLTEQRHPKTWDLSTKIGKNTLSGLEALLSVDEDISRKFVEMSENIELLERSALAVQKAIQEGRKIYIYGCGATGRLAKQMESSFWKPFWEKISGLCDCENRRAAFQGIKNSLIGEMTGADRALISSLEGFEDLQLIGKLQLEDHQIQQGDVVFAVTEGGETSSVIGTILAALNQYGEMTEEKANTAREHLYFIYNNPDSVLLPLDRSRSVIENQAISKIRLFTGPQAITGSTRLQATTSETFVLGIILEEAIHQVLKSYFSEQELMELGFDSSLSMKERLLSFLPVQRAVFSLAEQMAKLTDLESFAYEKKRFATYFAKDALITVFIDSTERAPTFRLFPLDSTKMTERKSWIQVWTPAEDSLSAWEMFLGRPFRGLNPALYQTPFSMHIGDPYLQRSALTSLKNAGDDQQFIYDFSFASFNIENRGPEEGDIGIMALLGSEATQLLDETGSFQSFLKTFSEKRAKIGLILVPEAPLSSEDPIVQTLASISPDILTLQLPIQQTFDPLKLRQHIGLKMLLNAHSTGIMAKLGRVVGNTMTYVNPGNLKLIGRATFLILSHVNDLLAEEERISYPEANAVLFDAIEYAKKTQKVGQNSEVGLCIIRILESLKRDSAISWEEAERILQKGGLETYLQNLRAI